MFPSRTIILIPTNISHPVRLHPNHCHCGLPTTTTGNQEVQGWCWWWRQAPKTGLNRLVSKNKKVEILLDLELSWAQEKNPLLARNFFYSLHFGPSSPGERLGSTEALGVAQVGWIRLIVEGFFLLPFFSFLGLFIRRILRDRFLSTRYCQSSGCYIF